MADQETLRQIARKQVNKHENGQIAKWQTEMGKRKWANGNGKWETLVRQTDQETLRQIAKWLIRKQVNKANGNGKWLNRKQVNGNDQTEIGKWTNGNGQTEMANG